MIQVATIDYDVVTSYCVLTKDGGRLPYETVLCITVQKEMFIQFINRGIF
jgi:hypothetical protein